MNAMWLRVMSYLTDILDVIPAAVAAGCVYLPVRLLRVRRGAARRTRGQEAARLLLVCYLAALLALTWVPANFWSMAWAKLFRGYQDAIHVAWLSGAFSLRPFFLDGGRFSWQMGANVLLYLPLGVLLPLVWREARWWTAAGAGFALSLATELFQPIIGRSFDVDDLLTNALGALAGYGLLAMVRRLARAAGRGRNGRGEGDAGSL